MPIQGSNAWIPPNVKRLVSGPAWWQAGSPLDLFLSERGCEHLNDANPYIWTTNMNGLAFWYRWFRRAPDYPDHKDWQAAGWHIKQYFEFQQIPVCDRVVLAYSHGIQPVLYACAYGLELARLLTVGGPVRADMQESAEIARRRIGCWLSVTDPFDVIQQGGQWFDGGRLVPVQCHPLAYRRDLIPGIGHGKVLEDPAFFHYWDRLGWAKWLRGELA